MKILWVINTIIPDIAEAIGLKAGNREGWLQGAFNSFSSNEKYDLSVAFPVDSKRNTSMIEVKGIKCYPFVENLGEPEKYNPDLENSFREILKEVNPDILHIFGTEFPHALAASRAFDKPERTLVGIQGICSIIAKDYGALLPKKVLEDVTFRDAIKKDSIKDQQKKFFERGKNEQELIRSVKYITGRTEFDKKTTAAINPNRVYFHMNESMRSCFYENINEGKWKVDNVEDYSIFLGQGDYPIKGMHFLIEAAGELVKKYPNLKIYVAGNSIIDYKSIKDKLKTPAYGKYLRKLIKEYNLQNHVKVLGSLTSNQMKEQYLRSSVFVCPSYVENSPNTVAEAMLLGVPIVASDAGGITSVISEKEGFIFKKGDVKRLARSIEKVWELELYDRDTLYNLCDMEQKRALKDYDPVENNKCLLSIYESIVEG